MKDISFQLGGEIDDLFLCLGSVQNNKALLSCYISKDLVSKKDFHAGKIIKDMGKFIRGGGGGQAFFATAGGSNPDGIEDALNHIKTIL
jgi:alanyl-tRNA synthetase